MYRGGEGRRGNVYNVMCMCLYVCTYICMHVRSRKYQMCCITLNAIKAFYISAVVYPLPQYTPTQNNKTFGLFAVLLTNYKLCISVNAYVGAYARAFVCVRACVRVCVCNQHNSVKLIQSCIYLWKQFYFGDCSRTITGQS